MSQSPLSPRLLQIIGLVMLIVFSVFWAITGKESTLLVGAAGSLILAAQYERYRDVLRDATKPAPIAAEDRRKQPRSEQEAGE